MLVDYSFIILPNGTLVPLSTIKDTRVFNIDRITNTTEVTWGISPKISGVGGRIVRIHFDGEYEGLYLDIGENHLMYTIQGVERKAGDVCIGDAFTPFIGVLSEDKKIMSLLTNNKFIKEFQCIDYDQDKNCFSLFCKAMNTFNPIENQRLLAEKIGFAYMIKDSLLYIQKQCKNCQKDYTVTWGKRSKNYCCDECKDLFTHFNKSQYCHSSKWLFGNLVVEARSGVYDNMNLGTPKNRWRPSSKEELDVIVGKYTLFVKKVEILSIPGLFYDIQTLHDNIAIYLGEKDGHSIGIFV